MPEGADDGSELVWAIVVAGGNGSRFGRPKQFEVLAGRRVLDRSVEAARSVAHGVVLVLPEAHVAEPSCAGAADLVVAGGPTRAASVRCGLAAVPEEADLVVVHDAARPLASPDLFRSVVEAVRAGAAGAVPVLAVTDTLKRLEGTRVVGTLPREGLATVQTPQAFRAGMLRRAHAGGEDATDDAGLVEALGELVVAVPGEARNLKLTSPDDIPLIEFLVHRVEEASTAAGAGR
jgi:2-C-methyl-D-erythritol 4-phosphate cytidylyltransferase